MLNLSRLLRHDEAAKNCLFKAEKVVEFSPIYSYTGKPRTAFALKKVSIDKIYKTILYGTQKYRKLSKPRHAKKQQAANGTSRRPARGTKN